MKMNRKNNMVWGTLVAALLASCVDTDCRCHGDKTGVDSAIRVSE
jgi:hypothetical protein